MEERDARSQKLIKILVFIFVLVSAGLILFDLSRNIMAERVREKTIMTSKSTRPTGAAAKGVSPADSGAKAY